MIVLGGCGVVVAVYKVNLFVEMGKGAYVIRSKKRGEKRTEREGFEPSVRFDSYTHLAGERLQPDSAISPITTILTLMTTFVNNFLTNTQFSVTKTW